MYIKNTVFNNDNMQISVRKNWWKKIKKKRGKFLENLLYESCKQMNIVLEQKQIQQFMKYKQLLLQWNEKMNLTAITEEREVILKHFVDCVSVLSYINLQQYHTVIDVGTGAGFPGIPLKIACPSIHVTLLDSLQKRIYFLEEVVQQLLLKDVECVHSRAEDGGKSKKYREQYDCCVSRAVANLSALLEYGLPFVKVGGLFVALKGKEAAKEVEQSQKAMEVLGGELCKMIDVTIPNIDLNHKIVVVKKVKQTPAQYPRKAGKVLKNEIQ